MTNTAPTIKIHPKRALLILSACSVLLVVLSIWGQYLKYFSGSYDIRGPIHEFFIDLLMQAFYMDAEGNVPTYFNTIVLFIPAILFAVISAWKFSIKEKFGFHWLGLALIFLYLSMDEAAVLHERLIKPMRSIINFEGYGGIFYFAWVIPGIAAVIIFLLAYLRFFLHLENKFKLLFFVSLAIYLSGVIGGELLSGHFAETIGLKNFTYAMYTSLEESLELFGASMIAYSLLAYINQYLPDGIIFKT
jgi:hypothetical protein